MLLKTMDMALNSMREPSNINIDGCHVGDLLLDFGVPCVHDVRKKNKKRVKKMGNNMSRILFCQVNSINMQVLCFLHVVIVFIMACGVLKLRLRGSTGGITISIPTGETSIITPLPFITAMGLAKFPV